MANFLAGFIGNDQTTSNWWSLDIDSASNVKGSREKIILEGPDNVTLEQALKLNQAEYEALIAGLKLAREVEAKKLRCYTNS